MKKSIILLLVIIFANSVFAVHESIPNVNWDNSNLDSFKDKDLCKCWSLTEQIKKYRNSKLNAVFVAKQCMTVCYHCDDENTRGVDRCLSGCLSKGGLTKEEQLTNCIEQCIPQYCTNEVKIELEPKSKEKHTPVNVSKTEIKKPVEKRDKTSEKEELVKIPESVEIVDENEEEIKVEKVISEPKKTLTLKECESIAKQVKVENFCDDTFTFSKFVTKAKKLVGKDEEISGCVTAWNEQYKLEKKKCVKGIIDYLVEKKMILPLLLIITAFTIIIIAVLYYFHRKKWHPIEYKEEEIKVEFPKELEEKEPIKNKPRKSPFTKNPKLFLEKENND